MRLVVFIAWKISVFGVFSPIWTKYEDLLCKSPYSVQMWENTDQKNSEYKFFLGNGSGLIKCLMSPIETLD